MRRFLCLPRLAVAIGLLLIPALLARVAPEPPRAAASAAFETIRPPAPALGARPARMAAPDAAITVCAEGCDHRTIGAALATAETGDAIFVGNGVYAERLVIETSVELRGVDPASTVIDADEQGTAITIRRGVGVTITGFTVTGGRAESGAGIFNEGSVFLYDCVIEGNETTDPARGFGGGVFNYGGTMTLTDVVVQDNAAQLGGGVLNSYGGMTIARGAIRRNRAVQFGGGIFNGLTANLGVDTVDLSENRVEGGATPRGAGIFNTGFAFISRSSLSRNQSRESGGAIFQYADTTILSNSTMSANVADFGGSGMYIAAGEGLMTNVTVADNSGGFGAVFSNDVIEIRNSLIGNNAPSSCFGAITSTGHNLDSGNTCSFDQPGDMVNTNPRTLPVGDHGGPTQTIALTAASPAIDAGDPLGCTAPDDTLLTTDQRGSQRPLDGDGDGLPICDIGAYEYFDEEVSPEPTPRRPEPVPGQLTVCESGCDFDSVQAAVDAAPAGATVAIQAGTYVENVLIDGKALSLVGAGAPFTILDGGRAGPVIEIRGAVPVTVRGLAATKGGGIVAPDADLRLQSCAVTFNSDPRAGGVYSRARLTVEDCDIASNVSLTRGGGIHVDGGIATVRRSRIRANTSAVDGGGIYVSGQLTLEDSELSGNGGRYGGGVAGRGANITVTGSSLQGNRAEYGAGLFLLGGQVGIEGGELRGNRADVGGGLYVGSTEGSAGSAELSEVALLENVAEGSFGTGGALVAYASTVRVEGGQARDNRGNFGGAFYHTGATAELELVGVTASLNSATLGGALYARSGRSTLQGCILDQNAATESGGAIHADGGRVTVSGGRLTANSAVLDGGAAHSGEAGELTIEGARIANNTAGRHGGALRVGSQLRLSEVELERNSADGAESQGGAISIDAFGSAFVEQSLLAGNVSRLGGAAAVSGTLAIENSTIHDNAALAGAGLYSSIGALRLASVTLAGNRVETIEGETGGAAGIALQGGGASASLRNSIVALGQRGPDCSRAVESAGYNLDSDGSCGLSGPGDLSDQDPGLSELRNNAGRTRTLSLLVGSVAVDAANPAGCLASDGQATLTTDQRGLARVVDGDGDGQARCDMGAFELRIRDNTPTVYLPRLARGE